jgi:hypothetical protein
VKTVSVAAPARRGALDTWESVRSKTTERVAPAGAIWTLGVVHPATSSPLSFQVDLVDAQLLHFV